MDLNVVLDLDDTLYLERDYVRSGFGAVDDWLKPKGFKGFFPFAWTRFSKNDSLNLYSRFLAGKLPYMEANILADQCVNIYREHFPSITILNDAKLFLSEVRSLGKGHLFMITDGRLRQQQNKISALNIANSFRKIVITGVWGPAWYKPNQRAFLEISEQFPGRCIYIGDNPNKDFVAPTQLNWLPSIRIKRPDSLHEALQTPANVHEARDLNEAITMLPGIITP